MNLIIAIFFFLTNGLSFLFSRDDLCSNSLLINSGNLVPQEYIPLRFSTLKTFIVTNPCNTKKSILIRNNSLYEFDRKEFQWKQLCISRNILHKQQIPIVNSIAHLNHDLILIIHGILFRTQDRISSSKNKDIIYRVLRYSNLPILSKKIDYVFTTPCCACLQNTTYGSISYAFNEYIILANKDGNVILFYFKSMTLVYDFGNIFQYQPVCKLNQCTILHLGLVHSVPMLICIIKYETEKAIIYHQSFLEYNSTFQRSTFINFTGDSLYITPTTFPNAYFFWDAKKIFYTTNGGLLLSEVTTNGCQLDHMDEYQLQTYYKNLEIDYDNITFLTKEFYCLNKTIDYIFLSNKEFFLITENNEWLYGKESFLPSMINLKQQKECSPIYQDLQNISGPNFKFNITQCLLNIDQHSLPCSSFVQSLCLYTRFEPLFDINQIYILEKNHKKYLKFILEAYTIIPIMIITTESLFFHYAINYTINRTNNGIFQIIGSFQIEASCSSASAIRVEKNIEFEFWNQSNPIIDMEWIRHNLPTNAIRLFSPVYIKRKQIDSILLKYQYCFNQTCRLIDSNQLDHLLIYAIPIHKEHENFAHYLINRSDSCIPISRAIYRLWLQWTLNMTARTQLFQIPYERRTFYRTLLNTLSISDNSCLFFNGSNAIHINNTINQAPHNDLKFILHIIAYNNKFSFCDLETFVLIEIEPIRNIHNSYRGFAFFITLFIFILCFILFINIYKYYKHQQTEKYLEYHRLNQIDAGQLHQWYDIARYLNQHKNTNNYDVIRNYLINLESTTSLTHRLMEYHT